MEDTPAERPAKRGGPAWRHVRRWGARLAVAFLSLFVAHAIAMNVFLSTSLFDKVLDGAPQTIYISYERGWSFWPGHVHARNLTIRSSDSNVQFILRLETCDFTFSPLDLALHKMFHVTQVNGSGISFRARQRLDAPAATPEFVDALAPIAGFERIPLPVLKPRDLLQRWNDRYWHLWTVKLENVVATDVREVWIDAMRWEGEARITGGFLLKPIREASVDHVQVGITRGKVTIVDRLVASPMTGSVAVNVAPFDPRRVTFEELLGHVTLTTDLAGRTPDLGNLPRGIFRPSVVTGPVEWKRLAFDLEGGKIASGTHVDATLPGASFALDEHALRGDLVLLADVADHGGQPQLVFRVAARDVDARRQGNPDVPLARMASAVVVGDARVLDLKGPLADLHVIATLPDVEMRDARAFARYVPLALRETVAVHVGSVHAHGELEVWLAERRARGQGALEATTLELGLARLRARGDVHAEGAIDSYHWEMKALEGAQATVRIANGSLGSTSSRFLAVDGLVASVHAEDVDLVAPLRTFRAELDVTEAEVFDRGLLVPLLPEHQVSGGHARFSAHAQADVKRHVANGDLAIHASELGAQVDAFAFATDLRAHVRFHGWSLADGSSSLLDRVVALDEASIELSDLHATHAQTHTRALGIASIALRARSTALRPRDPFSRIELEARVKGGAIQDPLAINAFLPKKADALLFDASPTGARFDVAVSATLEDHVAHGTVTALAHGVGVRGKKLAVLGNVEALVDVADLRLDERTLRVKSSHVALDAVAMRLGSATPGQADLVADHVEVDFAAESVALRRSAGPTLAGVDWHLLVKGAQMPDVRPIGELLSSDPLAFAIESGKASADIDLRSSARAGTASGHALVVLEDAGVRFHATRLAGNFQVDVRVHGVDPVLDGVDLSGSTVTMRNVRTAGAKAVAAGWDGDVTLLGGAIRLTRSPAFDGFLQLRADDANPVLALVLQNSLPRFVVGLLKANQLTGQARVVVEPGRAAILGARVRGGNVVMRGNYVAADHHVRGAVIVAKGPFSAGVNVDDGGTHVRLNELEPWMKSETTAALSLFRDPRAESHAASGAAAR